MLDRFFRLSENHTNVRTELLAGLTTFLTMAYIIVVQPMVLSGKMAGQPTGMDFGAVTTATCIAAALASAIMGLYGRYPIAQAPGMGENFFFVSLGRRLDGGDVVADRTGRGVLLGRDLPAAFDAGRARETDGGHQPQHAQRHRRRHRTVHRADRHGQCAPAAEKSGLRLEAESRSSPRPT